MTSPCSVTLISPSSVPHGWARIASWVGPPPRPTVPPRPWKSRSRTPCRPATSRSARWARWISHCDVVMPGVLVGVGVAEHHLLHVAAQRDEPAVRRVAEQVVEHAPGLAQLVDGLEQRHEADPRDAAVQVDQAGLAGQQRPPRARRRRPGSSRRCSSRTTSGPKRSRASRIVVEHRERAGARRRRAPAGCGRQRAPPGELLAQQREAVRARQVGVAAATARRAGRRAAASAWWWASACSRTSRVARCRPNVATVRISAVHATVARPARRGGSTSESRISAQVGEQLGAAEVVAARVGAAAPAAIRSRVLRQLELDAAALEPVRLLGVEPPDPRGSRSGRAARSRSRLASSSGLAPTSCSEVDRSSSSVVDERRQVAQRVPVLEHEDLRRDRGGDVRVAVAVAADPAAEPQRAGVGRQLDAERAQLVGELLEHVGDGVAHQLVEVVGRVARLVDRLRAVVAQLVGLPQQVDDLGEPPVVRGRSPAGVEQVGDPAALGQDRAAGGLGGVCGEHGAYGEPRDQRATTSAAGSPAARIALGGARQPAALRGPLAPQLAGAVHLLGDVGQVEVGAEGADEPGRGRDVDALEQVGQRRRCRTGSSARTRSTRSSSSRPSWRTSDSPSRFPSRRTSARRAACSAGPCSAWSPAVTRSR